MNCCSASGCFERVKPPALFCTHHWRRLPAPIAHELEQPVANLVLRAQAVNDAIRHLSENELRTYAHAV